MYSKLATYVRPTLNNHTKGREGKTISGVVIHCTAGNINATTKQMTDYFYDLTREASCNYVVCRDGIGVVVEEENRSWCSSNRDVDMESISIEVASESKQPYRVLNETLNNLIDLLADICIRYNLVLKWSTDKNERIHSLNGVNMRCHRDYKSKECPGQFLYDMEGEIADKVNKKVSEMSAATSENKEELNMAKPVTKDTTELTKLAGKSVIDETTMRDEIFAKKYPAYKDIVQYYYQAEKAYGIRADLAICQSLLETGHFSFKGYVKPEWCNYAGLGATDKDANKNIAIFANPFLGICAQMQHIYAYVFTDDPTKKYPSWVIVDPRFNLVKRGSAPYVEILGQKENKALGFGGYGWATGKDYGYKIMKIYNDLLSEYGIKEESEPVHIDIPDFLQPSNKVEDLTKRRDTKDVWYQINPSKINVFSEADATSRVLKTIDRGRIKVTEEQNGFGLIEDGWVQLMWCSYIEDAE